MRSRRLAQGSACARACCSATAAAATERKEAAGASRRALSKSHARPPAARPRPLPAEQAKVKSCAKLAKDELRAGNCVVIGLQSTGEANTNAVIEQMDELNDLVRALCCAEPRFAVLCHAVLRCAVRR